ncbi:hypothetical protein ABVT39_005363 [Epinephelus coioides]
MGSPENFSGRSEDQRTSPTPAVTKTGPEPVVCLTPEQEKQERHKQTLTLKERVVMRIYKEAKVDRNFGEPYAIINGLFQRIWAVVEGVDFEITLETFRSMEKAIFKELCSQRVSPV